MTMVSPESRFSRCARRIPNRFGLIAAMVLLGLSLSLSVWGDPTTLAISNAKVKVTSSSSTTLRFPISRGGDTSYDAFVLFQTQNRHGDRRDRLHGDDRVAGDSGRYHQHDNSGDGRRPRQQSPGQNLSGAIAGRRRCSAELHAALRRPADLSQLDEMHEKLRQIWFGCSRGCPNRAGAETCCVDQNRAESLRLEVLRTNEIEIKTEIPA
jgi:hypothetical protein